MTTTDDTTWEERELRLSDWLADAESAEPRDETLIAEIRGTLDDVRSYAAEVAASST